MREGRRKTHSTEKIKNPRTSCVKRQGEARILTAEEGRGDDVRGGFEPNTEGQSKRIIGGKRPMAGMRAKRRIETKTTNGER